MTKIDYSITKIPTAKNNIPQRVCQKNGILPRFPFSMIISGRSGSGKTNVLLSLLTEKKFLKGYFHYIVVFSPTAGEGDDMYDILELPKENFKNDFTEDDLEGIIKSRKELINKKGIAWVAKNSRVLILMDDVIANRSFLMSETALKCFALLRHYLCSVIILTQAYNGVPKKLRNNCNGTIIFPANQSEVEIILDEITPAGMRKRDFEQVIKYATEEQYSFLYINRHAKPGEQIRKQLNDIIDLEQYKRSLPQRMP